MKLSYCLKICADSNISLFTWSTYTHIIHVIYERIKKFVLFSTRLNNIALFCFGWVNRRKKISFLNAFFSLFFTFFIHVATGLPSFAALSLSNRRIISFRSINYITLHWNKTESIQRMNKTGCNQVNVAYHIGRLFFVSKKMFFHFICSVFLA